MMFPLWGASAPQGIFPHDGIDDSMTFALTAYRERGE